MKVKLEELYLSSVNPRFKEGFAFNSVDGKYFRKNQILNDKNDWNCMNKILQFEGNFSNLVDLFESIKSKYNDFLEKPHIIESMEKNKWIVVEGNRRILVLKCLQGHLKFPSSTFEIKNYEKTEDDEWVSDYANEDIEYNEKIVNGNIKKINKIIFEYKKNKNLEIDTNFIKKDDKEKEHISIAIFTNHITGKKKGKRNWNRGKTLDMYSSIWNTTDGNEDEKIFKISNLLNRTKRDVKDNLLSSQFIIYLINKADKNKKNFFIKNKISSLEIQFIKKFINYENENRFKDNIEFKKTLKKDYEMIKIKEEKKIKINKSSSDICKLILEALEKKWFNTRGINEKYKEEIVIKLSHFFGETEHFGEKDYAKNIYELKGKNVIELINKKKNLKNKNSMEFINFIEVNIKKSNTIEINYDSPISKSKKLKSFREIFSSLLEQYKILNKNTTTLLNFPINGIMSTLRSIIENVSYLLMFDKNFLEKFKKNNLIRKLKNNNNEICNKDCKKNHIKNDIEKCENINKLNFDSIYLNKNFSNLHKTLTFIIEEFKKSNKETKENIIDSLKLILNNNSISNIENLDTIFSKKTFKNSSRMLHSPHQLFLKNNDDLVNKFKININLLNGIIIFLKEIKILK